MAARGYPGTPGERRRDRRPRRRAGAKVFHAGTALADGRLVAAGGRVLGVTARGASVAEAQRAAYAAVDTIDFPDRLLPPRHRLARDRAPGVTAGYEG